jgi:hypothetical protein
MPDRPFQQKSDLLYGRVVFIQILKCGKYFLTLLSGVSEVCFKNTRDLSELSIEIICHKQN